MSILQRTAVSEWKCMTSVKFMAVSLLLLFSFSLHSQCLTVNGSTGTDLIGTQAFTGRMGMRFTVNSPIVVSRLGAFDSGQDGLNSNITVAIVNAAGTVVVPSTGTPMILFGFLGAYDGSFLMNGGFTPVTLLPGTYTVVAYGYGASELNGNTNSGSNVAITNSGGGLITHIDSPWDNTAAMGVPGSSHIIGGFHAGNFTFSGLAPTLTTTINGVSVVSNNNGVDDTGAFVVCNGASPNITINSFTEGTGQSNIYVQQEYTTSNTTLVPWCNNCEADVTLFNGATATVALIPPALSGTVTLRFRAFVDADGSDDFTPGECTGDWIQYNITINAVTAAISPDPAEACILTDLQLNGNPSGGSGTYTGHLWSGPGAVYLNSTTIVNPIFNHNAIGSYNLVYQVTDSNGCTGTDDIDVTLRDVGLPEISCPDSPVTMFADEDRCSAVVCFPVSAMDLCPVNLPVTLAGHTYIGTFNGHTYFRSNAIPAGILSWEQANSAAVALGGHLVSINDQNEQSFLNTNIPNGALNQFWIGLRYSPSLNQFKWTSGEPVNYFNWGVGQPVNVPPLSGDYVYHLEVGPPAIEGWYNLLDILPRRYIVEFQGFPVTLVSGLPSGSNFPVGTTSVTYRATDSAGNTDECTFDVTVTDNQAPEITCPDNVTVQLDPLACEGVAVFGVPTTDDNCPLETYSLITPLVSGAMFPIGDNIVTYEAEDASGNTAQCSFTVAVLDYVNPSLGCINVNLSLDEDCEGELTPTEVLTGWEGPMGEILLGCLDLYEINVTGKNGEDLGNTLGNAELGKKLKYTITNANGFICWGDVTVEDKIAPTIICSDITVNCLADLADVDEPEVDDNCSGVKAVLVNEVHQILECDATYIGTVVRTWKAVDAFGNESGLCTQTIRLLRSSNDGITAPPANVVLKCSPDYAPDNKGYGYPSPAVTGVPLYNLIPLYPLSQLNMLYCNALIDYTDVLLVNTKCKKRILRTWSITEWWCSTAVTLFISMQVIDIVDDEAPVIPQQTDITVTTGTRSCSAAVLLPQLMITDNCTDVYKVYVNARQNGVPSGYVNGNGGLLDLGVGIHTITYSALDECGNQREMSYRITVKDDTDPVAICDQFATVSIKTNGYTEVTAVAIDDGSFDECGEVTLKVRRMEDPCSFGHDTAWYDKVGFCCFDANTTRMVQLLVTDAGGNTNICMVSVNVQEKVNPTITCLADITIEDCNYTFDPLHPADYFGEILIDDNCPAGNQLRDEIRDNRNQCGIGTVVRTTSVLQGGIIYQTCVQTITFVNDDPFYIDADPDNLDDDIVWPDDYTALGQCSVLGLDPSVTGEPMFTEDACDLVGMRYEDAVFPFTTNGACFKIIRTWTVIDWCQVDDAGNHRTWSYEQEIKIMDNDVPVITSSTASRLVVTFDGLCQDGQIVLTASATDCTPTAELRWIWVVTQGGIVFRTGTGSDASGTYPIGIYEIEFTVEDNCGNVAETGYDFEIRNGKAPTAVCKQGLSASLVLMDTDGDGIGDTPMTMLSPEFFDNKSSHVCGYPLELSFSSDINDTIAVFGCGDRGPQSIQMWVTDINGNTSYCQTFVDIQATAGLCPEPPMILANVSGRTVKEDNTEIEDVIVEMKGSEQAPEETDHNGQYAFAPMPTGGSYQIVPGKDGDDINGVSTLDIVMIQRHILGVEKLSSPYKLIAADANNSGSITASDLTELRKLVLGLTMTLPTNTSWRFVDADYHFTDGQDPWLTPFAERYQIDQLNGNMNINFIGIKIGDVNGNAQGRNVTGKTTEKRSKINLVLDDKMVKKGDIIEIGVKADGRHTLYGMQAQWKTRGLIIREMREGSMNVRPEEYVITEVNSASMSVASGQGKNVSKDETLFIIEVEALQSGSLREMLSLGESVRAEAYVEEMETRTLGITWREKTEGALSLVSTSPNPWHTNTSVTFEIPADGMVSFNVKDYTGRKLISTTDQYSAGKNTIHLSRSDIGQSGVYVYELRYGDKVVSGKMILID